MGLDCSHDCFHGAYSSFNRWRNEIARIAGYEFEEYDGIQAPVLDWDNLTQKNVEGEWDKTPDEPLLVLFAHSDCDGVIHPEQAKALADRLDAVKHKLPKKKDWGHIGSWQETTQKFIDGLLLAAENGEDVEFG
jgi:hypothetical protein